MFVPLDHVTKADLQPAIRSNLVQSLHQPPFPPPAHRQHRFPPIIPLFLPVRIPQNSRISPKHSCHPRRTGYEHRINWTKHINDHESEYAVDAEVAGCVISVSGAYEAELDERRWGEKAVEAGGRWPLGGAEAEGVEDEEEEGG